MQVDSKRFLKCGAVAVPHFFRNRRSFFATTGWSFYSLPTGPGNRAYSKKSLRYTTKSIQMIEKVKSEMDVKEDFPVYPALSSYDAAMEALSSLITRRNRGDPSSTTGRSHDKLARVSMYLKILGLEEKIKELKIIHVAGTKGKGSTCVFSEAILRNCGFRTGLFTSPHLIDVRERFRIDGLDISEEKFLQYFWECWNLLNEKAVDGFTMPPLFQFLTVLAFKIFVCEKVDVAVIEVGLGGKLDATNVIQEPIVCGITSLGMDHMETLGHTLAEIASHKAGIFKPQIPAFTVPQLSEAMEVLQETAKYLKAPLKVAAPLDIKKLEGVALGLSGDHQLVNAGLAVSLSRCWLQRTGNWEKISPNGSYEDEIPEAFRRGLEMAQLRGRAQVVHDIVSDRDDSSATKESPCGDLIFYLDGAHSPESMEACGRWFSASVKGNKRLSPPPLSSFEGVNGYIKHDEFGRDSNRVSKQILLFNCMEVRDPQILLPRLINTCASSGTHFSRALFVPSLSTYNKVISGASTIPSDSLRKDLAWQFMLQRLWERLIHGTDRQADAALDGIPTLPPPEFLYGDTSHCSPSQKPVLCSAVMPSLPLTINWLRDCVRKNPSLKLEVLVTGSLHLVGDVLRLLKR
ncbi:PREDICTED: folylpolyglutamate synthase isoform X2 [Tarenaya hassleriana]|nr:PREDICTED: folylpolyglutamate synthase isoform X2 [Tarenaya hassleriana]XP_010543506.1 PREDICTED: folylpolyglutamate synthase isoform X2 [Tarenaya hassleriana]XP_010543507.1 PREDICTED: folylpolyglutamate synthase isoform X2 [Tarenaya hassleriana]